MAQLKARMEREGGEEEPQAEVQAQLESASEPKPAPEAAPGKAKKKKKKAKKKAAAAAALLDLDMDNDDASQLTRFASVAKTTAEQSSDMMDAVKDGSETQKPSPRHSKKRRSSTKTGGLKTSPLAG